MRSSNGIWSTERWWSDSESDHHAPSSLEAIRHSGHRLDSPLLTDPHRPDGVKTACRPIRTLAQVLDKETSI